MPLDQNPNDKAGWFYYYLVRLRLNFNLKRTQ